MGIKSIKEKKLLAREEYRLARGKQRFLVELLTAVKTGNRPISGKGLQNRQTHILERELVEYKR